LKRDYQVVYAIILILLIPLAIILNTIWSVKTSQYTTDLSLQRQAYNIGKMFNYSIYQNAENDQDLQNKIDLLKKATLELETLEVLEKEGERFRIVASMDHTAIGRSSDDLNYIISWHKNEAIATLVSGKVETGTEEERFWELVMPLSNSENEKQAVLSMRMSLKIMDDLTKATLAKSYFFLVVTVLIVILLLALNTRLFEHAILFRKLKEVDKMKDEFISIASHELRTPITTLKGYLSMALDGDYGELNEGGQKGFKIMEASVNRLGNLVEDLLNVSRIEQNRLAVNGVPIELPGLLGSIVDEFELRIKEKGLALKPNIPDDLPKVFVDEDKLRQILVNLIGNSVKYTKEGEVELIVEKDDKFVTITIKDTGIGMSAEDREKLFDKFYRIQSNETRGIVGTGLGLWITKQLVELMGGKIFVDSIKHVGSQFYFTVPIYDPKIHKIKETKNIKKTA